MKSQRQAKIIEIITSREVETQEQLLEALNECGFRSTQATISRDIKELHIVKELTKFGTYRYAASAREVSGSLDIAFMQKVVDGMALEKDGSIIITLINRAQIKGRK